MNGVFGACRFSVLRWADIIAMRHRLVHAYFDIATRAQRGSAGNWDGPRSFQ